MAQVLTYSNTQRTCYSTVRLDSGEDIFISIVGSPRPKVTVYQSRLLGLRNKVIWEFTPQMAGGYDAYVRKMARAFGVQPPSASPSPALARFAEASTKGDTEVLLKALKEMTDEIDREPDAEPQHPLDAIKDIVMTCSSVEEVRDTLFAAERRMNTPLPGED